MQLVENLRRLFRILFVACLAATIASACTVGDAGTDDAGTDANNLTVPFIGGPCEVREDCLIATGFDDLRFSSFCLPWSGGYCALFGCNDPGFTCPGTSRCVRGAIGGSGFCVNPCAGMDDCRPGFECYESMSLAGFHFCRAIPDDAGVDAGDDAGVDGG